MSLSDGLSEPPRDGEIKSWARMPSCPYAEQQGFLAE